MRHRLALAAGVVALAALAWALGGPNQINAYDQYWALIWGRELAGFASPDYASPFASTPHPLTVLVAAVLAPFGDGAARDLLAFLNLVAWATVVVCMVLIGHRLVGLAGGVLGSLAVIVNPRLYELLTASSADVFFAALLSVAVAVEVRRPRAGTPVLVLLAVAGLTRPEAWLLAGAYWLWCWPGAGARGRATSAAVVASAPVLWLLMDAAVTGDPLFSLSHTQEGAVGRRPTGVGEILPQLRIALQDVLDAPEMLGAACCAALLAHRRERRALIPAAVVVLSLAGFAALGVLELPMLARYLIVVGALVTAAMGWLVGAAATAAGRERVAAGAAALLVLAVFASRVPGRLDAHDGYRADHAWRNAELADLREVLRRVPDAACPLWTNHSFKSPAVYETGREPDAVAVLLREPPRGHVLLPTTPRGERAYTRPNGAPLPFRVEGPAVAEGRYWRVVDAGCSQP